MPLKSNLNLIKIYLSYKKGVETLMIKPISSSVLIINVLWGLDLLNYSYSSLVECKMCWLDPHLQPMNRRCRLRYTHTLSQVVVMCQKVKRGVTTIHKLRIWYCVLQYNKTESRESGRKSSWLFAYVCYWTRWYL